VAQIPGSGSGAAEPGVLVSRWRSSPRARCSCQLMCASLAAPQSQVHPSGSSPSWSASSSARSVRESASLVGVSSVPGPPGRPAAATPASAIRPGQDAAQGWHCSEGAGRGLHPGKDATRGRG
jgi:hypothetical protein